jgi:hypothetical protein
MSPINGTPRAPLRPRIGYEGQRYKVTVEDADLGGRRLVCWLTKPASADLLASLTTRPSWSDAKCEDVVDRKTGDA